MVLLGSRRRKIQGPHLDATPIERDLLIEFEFGAVVFLKALVLLGLGQHAVADHQQIEFVSHETAEGVLWQADDRLTANVEARIDEDWAAGQRLKSLD